MTIRTLAKTDAITTRPLGDFCPYYLVREGNVVVADTAEEIFDSLPAEERVVDAAGLVGLLLYSWIPGDLTLVEGVRRMPWRATLHGDGRLERQAAIPHGNRDAGPKEIARGLLERLEAELEKALSGRRRIRLLLTGGLDSRVVAGVLKRLEVRLSASIDCVTWGSEKSRDVVYARRIAGWLDWPFHHVPYGAEETWRNLERGAVWGGSEVPGFHLHGMDWLRTSADPGDLVLASSFGDSIGRAEFSGRHVSEIRVKPSRKRRSLLHPDVAGAAITRADRERARAWESEESAPEPVRAELDQQENYMRRMICHAMDYVRRGADLYQAFTDPELVRYMWSFSGASRTDRTYHELLGLLDRRLVSLPWARTGVAPDGTRESDSSLTVRYHRYGAWLRDPLGDRIRELATAPGLFGLGVFERANVERLVEEWARRPEEKHTRGQHVARFASIEATRRRFGLLPCRRDTPVRDSLRRLAKRVRHRLHGSRTDV